MEGQSGRQLARRGGDVLPASGMFFLEFSERGQVNLVPGSSTVCPFRRFQVHRAILKPFVIDQVAERFQPHFPVPDILVSILT